MDAIAEFDFDATVEEEELSFRKGQSLRILEMDEDEHWFRAELDLREGFVPKNHIRMSPHAWFMGRMLSAELTEKLRHRAPGSFLVRHSHTQKGDYAISVREQGPGIVQHYRIKRSRETGWFSVWDIQFRTINDLIEHYKKHSIAKSNVCTLKEGAEDEDLVQAVFDFAGLEIGDLPFKAGDVIRVTKRDESGWLDGHLATGANGTFPETYVVPFKKIIVNAAIKREVSQRSRTTSAGGAAAKARAKAAKKTPA